MQKSIREAIVKLKAMNKDIHAVAEWLLHENDDLNMPSGPLSGIPFSIKECYAIKGCKITSGSKRMKPIECTEDAEVVSKLKQAGAVPIARGNTSEFLLGRETNNLLYGTTNNFINNTLTAGGSSGGDGSMAASGAVAFSIGTDIGGSCRYPAYFNGISGFKPASGQISKNGIFPVAGNDFVETLNSPGIMSKSIKTIRDVYNVIGNKTVRFTNEVSHLTWYSATDFDVKIKDESILKALHGTYDILKSNDLILKDISIPESGKLYNIFSSLMCGGFTHKIYEWSTTADGKKLSF